MKAIILIISTFLFITRELPRKVDFASAFNAGYDARWRDGLPRTANPHSVRSEAREWWDDGWKYKGWMPDWRGQ